MKSTSAKPSLADLGTASDDGLFISVYKAKVQLGIHLFFEWSLCEADPETMIVVPELLQMRTCFLSKMSLSMAAVPGVNCENEGHKILTC